MLSIILKILAYAYLGTTIATWAASFINDIYVKIRLKKEGYEFTNKGRFGIGDIIALIVYLLMLSVPIYQIVCLISSLDLSGSYDERKNYLEEAGSIEYNEKIENKQANDNKTFSETVSLKNDNKKDFRPMGEVDTESISRYQGESYRKTIGKFKRTIK